MGVRAFSHPQDQARQGEEPKEATEGKNPPGYLSDLLEETRILLPGTQVFAGFLITLPFTNRFDKLTTMQRNLYLIVFVAIMLALICFIMPAAYHRIARPVHNKQGLKVLATWVVIAGLVPFTVGTVLAVYLIMDVVVGPGIAAITALVIAAAITVLWWLFPILRVHDAVATPEEEA